MASGAQNLALLTIIDGIIAGEGNDQWKQMPTLCSHREHQPVARFVATRLMGSTGKKCRPYASVSNLELKLADWTE